MIQRGSKEFQTAVAKNLLVSIVQEQVIQRRHETLPRAPRTDVAWRFDCKKMRSIEFRARWRLLEAAAAEALRFRFLTPKSEPESVQFQRVAQKKIAWTYVQIPG